MKAPIRRFRSVGVPGGLHGTPVLRARTGLRAGVDVEPVELGKAVAAHPSSGRIGRARGPADRRRGLPRGSYEEIIGVGSFFVKKEPTPIIRRTLHKEVTDATVDETPRPLRALPASPSGITEKGSSCWGAESQHEDVTRCPSWVSWGDRRCVVGNQAVVE